MCCASHEIIFCSYLFPFLKEGCCVFWVILCKPAVVLGLNVCIWNCFFFIYNIFKIFFCSGFLFYFSLAGYWCGVRRWLI